MMRPTGYDRNPWSPGQFSTLCNDVVSRAGMTDISGMLMVQARTIEVQLNASFEVLGMLASQ